MSRTRELESRIASLGSAVVAYSGGVDSSLVAALAARALGDRALAVTAVSPALATGELAGARDAARAIGIAHEVITTDELSREGYVRNDRDRCYHCKTELYGRLLGLARRRGYDAVLSGANADDTGDWRPGLRAAAEHGVVHPLLEGGVGKEEVRALARRLGVPSADKPASPCLASRFAYGIRVTAEGLRRVDRAEEALRALGFEELRVRDHGELARIEVPVDEIPRAAGLRDRIGAELRRLGYTYVTLDLIGFRSGSGNEVLLRPSMRRPQSNS